MQKGIEYIKRKTAFYKIGRKRYFERLDRIAFLSLCMLIILGKIGKRYELDSTAITALDIICVLLFVFTVVTKAFSIWNEIQNNRKYYNSTFIASLPYLLFVFAMIVVMVVWLLF